jgi:Domain of unknown function (DUF3784)
MTAINVITGAFIILLGILIKHGNMENLIAGYNTMPSDKKKNFDQKGFSTLLRNCFILIGLVIIVGNFIFQWLGWFLLNQLIILISTGIFLPYLLVHGQKFDGNNSPEKVKRNQKIIISIYGVLLAILIAFLLYGYGNTKVKFENTELKISGLYGIELSYSSIDKVELLSEIPKVELKTNGFSLGCVMKGNFKLDKVGKCKLYLKTIKAPFIKVVYNGSRIMFLNFAESEETENVFQELNSKIKN